MTALGRLKSKMFVLDGEIGIPAENGFSFDALLQRIHPAASRVQAASIIGKEQVAGLDPDSWK
jgi:ATP-dependent DNA ligase